MLVSLAALACSSESAAVEPIERPPPPGPVPQGSDWASRLNEPPLLAEARRPPSARAAVLSDQGEDSEELVTVRRLVYRVNFIVAPIFRDRRALVSAPAGELHVDLSSTRLRARFEGPGWPVAEGSELRLREDVPGAYLFDGRGGRPLGKGELAAWFEGRTGGKRAQSSVRIRRDFGASEHTSDSPAELMCVLLAEWTNQPRDLLVRRCRGGALPPGFRFGPWSAELTAVVPLELPRSTLRADEVDPPRLPKLVDAATVLDRSAIERIAPAKPIEEPADSGPFVVDNQSDSRAIVIIQGVPVGWVDAGASLTIDGLPPGFYRAGAIRPFGLLRKSPKWLRVPGRLTL